MGGEARGHERLGRGQTIEVGRIERRVGGLTVDKVGLTWPKGAETPLLSIRKALIEQGRRPGASVTVLCDGEAALPGSVRAAVREPVTCILDWWHISMRVQHIQRSLRGIYALGPQYIAALKIVAEQVGRLRHLIWNGYHGKAHDELLRIRRLAAEIAHLNGEAFRRPVARLLWNCDDLRRYLANNTRSLINYGERYVRASPSRHHARRDGSTRLQTPAWPRSSG